MGRITKKKYALILFIVIIAVILMRLFIGQPSYVPSPSMKYSIYDGDFIWVDKLHYGAKLPKRFSEIPLINIFTWIESLRNKDANINWGYKRLNGKKKPELYDLAVYCIPDKSDVLLVKRLIGLPGDTLLIKDGELYINGECLKQPNNIIKTYRDEPVDFPENTTWSTHNYGPLIIPAAGMTFDLSENNMYYIKSIMEREGFDFSEGVQNIYTFRENYYFMLGDNRINSYDSRFTGFVSESDLEGVIKFVFFSIDTYSKSFPGFTFRNNRFFKKIE